MSTTEQYSATASRATSTVENVTDFWTQAVRTLSYQTLPELPQADLITAVERYFKFVQRTVDISRDFTIKWVEAGNMLSDVVREQADSLSGLVRNQAESTRAFVHEQADKAEQAGKELTRETRKPERDRARPANAAG
jgi:hypothetical protein